MGAEATYTEKLQCGGSLEVTTQGFRIQYYFPGPDQRHNGTFLNVSGDRVEKYISAFDENWREYVQLKTSIPAGGEFQQSGRMGMQIRIGGFHEGVCIQSYHMPIRTETQQQKVIGSYRYALKRATEAQNLLKQL